MKLEIRNCHYPSRARKNCSIKESLQFQDQKKLFLCGRLIQLNRNKSTGTLSDESGYIQVNFSFTKENSTHLKKGDIVEVGGKIENNVFVAEKTNILVPTCDNFDAEIQAERSNWAQLLKNTSRFQFLKFRSDFLQTVRQFFLDQGFIEIDAPTLVRAAGMEPHIEPFKTELNHKDGTVSEYFLHTSPEFAMKKMLVAGYEKIFYLGHVFRNGELAALHSPEFTMLEWYQAYTDYTTLMEDCQQLVSYIEKQLSQRWEPLWRTDNLLSGKWRTISLTQLMKTYCQFDLREIGKDDTEKLLKIVRSKGIDRADESWSLDDLFFILFLEFVEPHLGKENPIIVKDYPIWMASLAKQKENDPHFVERFELYIDAIELANAFTELNDPAEQYQRLLSEQQQRRQLGRTEIPIDMDFIKALKVGMPQAAGIALGVDRLMMVCTQLDQINPLLPYSF